MKRFFLFLIIGVSLLLGGNAYAINFMYDLNALEGGYTSPISGGDGKAGWEVVNGVRGFSEMTYYAETLSKIDLVTGDVKDYGLLRATGFNPQPNDMEGFNNTSNSGWTMEVTWGYNDNGDGTWSYDDTTALKGSLLGRDADGTLRSEFNEGQFSFYIDDEPTFLSGIGYQYTDDNDPLTFMNGELVYTVDGITGKNTVAPPNEDGSSYILKGFFETLKTGIMFDAATGVDLSTLPGFDLDFVFATTAGDTNPNRVDQFYYNAANELLNLIGFDTDGNPIFENDETAVRLDVISNHDSSVEYGVVPEPTTIALLGIGLLSLAGMARRKNE